MKRCLYSKCGKEFEPNKPKQKFCCDVHRVYYSRENRPKVQVKDLTKQTKTNEIKPPATTNTTIDTRGDILREIERLTKEKDSFVGSSTFLADMRKGLQNKIDRLNKQLSNQIN